MKTFQKYQHAHYSQPGAMEHYTRGRFGLPADVLERHMQIMNDLRTNSGGISKANKIWLLKQAQAAGRDLRQAAQAIQRVERIPDPERRAKAYVVASGAPDQALVDHALELSSAYSTTWGSTLAEDRLRSRDAQLAKSGQQHKFEDTPQLKRAREEATAVRRTIEAALQEKGLVPERARSLEEEQERARAYAANAADRLEATRGDAPLRDQIESAWHVDQAFQRLNDTGVSSENVGSVMEKTDEQRFAARSIDG